MPLDHRNYNPDLMYGASETISDDLTVTDTLTVGGVTTHTGAVVVDSTTDTTSGVTGSIQTDGGVGIAKALYVGTTSTLVGAVTFSGTQVGQKQIVTASGGTTRTLTAPNTGTVNLFDSAAGIAYTLPATAVGLFYDFVTTVTQTSSAHSVVTPASSFIVGTVLQGAATSATVLVSTANGSSHTTISTNGTTTGGVIGTRFRLTAVTSTVWEIFGFVIGTGSHATPFA